jgi:hypothetical protein
MSSIEKSALNAEPALVLGVIARQSSSQQKFNERSCGVVGGDFVSGLTAMARPVPWIDSASRGEVGEAALGTGTVDEGLESNDVMTRLLNFTNHSTNLITLGEHLRLHASMSMKTKPIKLLESSTLRPSASGTMKPTSLSSMLTTKFMLLA